jgi:hypothetical protein
LPGGNGAPYFFSTDHGADRNNGAANGVDYGELLDLRGTLTPGITFGNLIAGVSHSPTDTAGLRIGIHVISLPRGFSEGLITSAAVPEPGTWGLMALGLGGLVLRLRRRSV